MYDSYMKTATFPLAIPADLLGEVRKTAKDTGLSMADAMRQSMKLGLPKLRDQLAGVRPMTKEEAKRAFAPDPEWDQIAADMARHQSFTPEE